ncbi:galactose oxidase-like protein 7 [Elsinoe australis]|uniref:Galactose oxidase-like protein 7 n=1 Tax=Elsinoe australis TaxID=40998 RepID=A0A4U7ANL3_9PEZI|nr:galactose oxidase-like protein 7 [Elsinoe australis]
MSVPLGIFVQAPTTPAKRDRSNTIKSTATSSSSSSQSPIRLSGSSQNSPDLRRFSIFDSPRTKSFSGLFNFSSSGETKPQSPNDSSGEKQNEPSSPQTPASTSSSAGSISRPRSRYIPIVIPELEALTRADSHRTGQASRSSSIKTIVASPDTKARDNQNAGLSPIAPASTLGQQPLQSPHDTLLQSPDSSATAKRDQSQNNMSRPTAASSRSSTLDSTVSAPSPDQLSGYDGLGTKMSSVNSSSTSLAKRAIQESEEELRHSAPRSDSTAHPNQIRTSSPPPPLPTQQPAQLAANASSSSHLSGLVCNVHRTTGKEPHALVGASTTILGDKLYVFGGRRISRSRPALTSDLFELDLLRRHWTRVDVKGDIPPPRYFHSVCALGDTKLVCYGGMSPDPTPASAGGNSGETNEAQVSVMSDVHIYDVTTQTWIKVNATDNPQGRYAHCAAILPSSAVFASANAPLSAIHHNPSGEQANQGAIGHSLDGTGGAEMIVVGGQDSGNNYIEQISIFNLRSLKWTSTSPTTGRSCGAYRSVVTPLTTMKASELGAGVGKAQTGDDEPDDPSHSGAPMLIYTNYNFLDVKLELQVRNTDGSLMDKPMQAAGSPPGLRFPSGGIIDNHFVVAGTFLTSSKQEFALWALDLRTLSWAKIDVASSIFSSGSWNRGVLWSRRNAFVILGNRKRNLVDDYNNRRLNFSNICLVQLEAFGLYDNPRKTSTLSGYISVSAPTEGQQPEGIYRSGAMLSPSAVHLGESSLMQRELSDMEILALDGTRIPVNSRLLARRWGSTFNILMQEANPALAATDTLTLRPSAASIISRNSSITITPSFNTSSSGGTTLTPNANSIMGDLSVNSLTDPADVRNFPSSARPRIIYLPHTVPTINALLHFLYASSLPPVTSPLATPQILCSLLQLARPYKVDGLLEAVVERLHESLDGRNAAAIFNAAAMGAGGGDGLDATGQDMPTHPPRTASLAGSMEGLNLNNASDRSALRIDTDMANGVSGRPSPSRSASVDGNMTEEDDDKVPDSASTNASMASQMSASRPPSRKQNDEVWNGGWSAVIGLQKRGLRGLMEGRRLRERGKGPEGQPAGPESSRVGLGIA